jgi:hypothetical protein
VPIVPANLLPWYTLDHLPLSILSPLLIPCHTILLLLLPPISCMWTLVQSSIYCNSSSTPLCPTPKHHLQKHDFLMSDSITLEQFLQQLVFLNSFT